MEFTVGLPGQLGNSVGSGTPMTVLFLVWPVLEAQPSPWLPPADVPNQVLAALLPSSTQLFFGTLFLARAPVG